MSTMARGSTVSPLSTRTWLWHSQGGAAPARFLPVSTQDSFLHWGGHLLQASCRPGPSEVAREIGSGSSQWMLKPYCSYRPHFLPQRWTPSSGGSREKPLKVPMASKHKTNVELSCHQPVIFAPLWVVSLGKQLCF